ncbi:MAG: xanthine dehydrogenase family protein subunit M [Burkholderiaceae bacterium]
MKLADVAYERPSDLSQALAMISDTSRDIRVLAGGQSLLAALNFRLGEPDLLVDINRIAQLKGISEQNGVVRIGALTRHVDVMRSPIVAEHLPLIARAIHEVAHPAIRHRGTFGGSIALADPAAELPACLLACNGSVIIASVHGERQVAADNYFKGLYDTDLQPGEIITAVQLPSHAGNDSFFAFAEFARRRGDFANAGVAITARNRAAIEDSRIVLFGVSDKPVRATTSEALLNGQPLDADNIERASEMATEAIAVFSDIHTGEAMKRHLCRVMMRRALTAAVSGAGSATLTDNSA